MKKSVETILALIIVTVALAIIAGWFWGVPYLATLVFDGTYWLFATIWLSIHLIRSFYKINKLNKMLKQYSQIDGILKGAKK